MNYSTRPLTPFELRSRTEGERRQIEDAIKSINGLMIRAVEGRVSYEAILISPAPWAFETLTIPARSQVALAFDEAGWDMETANDGLGSRIVLKDKTKAAALG